MTAHRALVEAEQFLRAQGQNELADRLANAELDTTAELGSTPELEPAPRLLVEDDDEAWKQAAGAAAWKAITAARARAGRPIE